MVINEELKTSSLLTKISKLWRNHVEVKVFHILEKVQSIFLNHVEEEFTHLFLSWVNLFLELKTNIQLLSSFAIHL